MEIPLYLTMTAAEVWKAETLPDPLAWMACHFSSYGTGISNVPKELPAGSMLMLNDRIPFCGHDPQQVAQTLCDVAEELKCSRILLDFQRQNYPDLTMVIQAVLEKAHCPVGVSLLYAQDFNCPVLLPPIPPHVPPEEVLMSQKDRELWLELSAEGTEIIVSPEGSRYTSLPYYQPETTAHFEPDLHCHYTITLAENQVRFQLGRTPEDRFSFLQAVSKLGVSCALELWQEIQDS